MFYGATRVRAILIGTLLLAALSTGYPRPAPAHSSARAQQDVNAQLERLTLRVSQLEARPQTLVRQDHMATGFLFLTGVFCALWAQNTNRNPWLWFFLGVIFSGLTLVILLANNAADRGKQRQREATSQ